jgi:hypothetical protein
VGNDAKFRLFSGISRQVRCTAVEAYGAVAPLICGRDAVTLRPIMESRKHRVGGVVLLRETQAGIPNLQVVLYDMDAGCVATLRQWLRSMDTPADGLWAQLQGDRLGSVLTTTSGQFELSFDADLARESKADLVVLIMAPEDSSCDSPLPRPAAERLLHVSFEPVIDAGEHESFVIRIPGTRLEALGIAAPVSEGAPLTATAAAEHVQRATAERVELDTARLAQVRALATPAAALKKRTASAFRSFSLSHVPPARRAEPTYFQPGDDLGAKQRLVADHALKAIVDHADRGGAKRRLALRLTQRELADLGLTPGPDGTVKGDVQGTRLMQQVARRSGTQLTRGPSPGERCKAEFDAERRYREVLVRCGADDDGSTDEGSGTVPDGYAVGSTDEFVREQLARQMRHVTSPETELAYGVERNGVLSATITRPGPAEVTSYHDFHELQIAFESIWKEAFDGKLVGAARELYAEAVRYTNQVSGVPEELIESINAPIETVDDLRRLYEDVRLLQQLIERDPGTTGTATTSAEKGVPSGPAPAPVKQLLPSITDEDWSNLESGEQRELIRLAADNADARTKRDVAAAFIVPSMGASMAVVRSMDQRIQANDRSASKLLREARERRTARAAAEATRPPETARRTSSSRLEDLMTDLDKRLSERFKFDIFAPGSINYGTMLTYRQAWTPGAYQVGDLVSTVPLAPKEVRRYSKKHVLVETRSRKELEDTQTMRKSEAQSTTRADAEIVKRASQKTSFQQSAEGTVNVGVFQGTFGTQFGVDSEKASSSTKKNFREAVNKAAEEYKQQHRVEVETTSSNTVELTDSGEIANPNDEITVTYLFYELQRQYQVREQIHRLVPVVLVANEMPDPDISVDWIIAHHWILRRVILDEGYLPALDYVVTSAVGDEMALEVMWSQLQRQAGLVDAAADHLERKAALAEGAFAELRRLTGLVQEPSDMEKFKDVSMAAAFGPFALIGLLGGDDEAAEKREEVAKLAIERADKDSQEATATLGREVAALQKAIDDYNQSLREHLDRQAAIAALRIHIKQNILCYMHAIWDYECGDQRYFRLYNLDVPWIETGEHTVHLEGRPDPWSHGGGLRLEGEVTLRSTRIVNRKLVDIADLDSPLGYKGNYSIFPVKEPNHLHWYMMQDFIDPETGGLRDPDDAGNETSEELLDYACCLKRRGIDEKDPRYQEVLDKLRARAASPQRESELIIVPTDALHIEALPGKHPVLEDFKLVHRAIDVKKVQAEVRRAELENVRLGARLLEAERGDPDVEKTVVVEGASDVLVTP